MRVLYIDVVGLLYSKRYLETTQVSFSDLAYTMSYKSMSIIESLPHDTVSARLLERAALAASLKIYPLEPFKAYNLVQDRGVFSESSLAPDIDWRGKLRLSNNGNITRMLIHAKTLGVKQWWCCGGGIFNWQLSHLQNRYLKSPAEKGVTPQLLRRIRAL